MFLQLEFINKESNYKMLVMSIYVNYATTKFIVEKIPSVLNSTLKFFLIFSILHLMRCLLFPVVVATGMLD